MAGGGRREGRPATCCEKSEGLRRGTWTPEEDKKLVAYVQKHGHDNWRAVPRLAGLQRCGKSCRLRWINYLRPDVKRGNFTREEEELIIKLHKSLGNKWYRIASCLPGRSDNEIKNFWNIHLIKKNKNKKKKKAERSRDIINSSPPNSPFSVQYSQPSAGSSSGGKVDVEGVQLIRRQSSSPSLSSMDSCVAKFLSEVPELLAILDDQYDHQLEMWRFMEEDCSFLPLSLQNKGDCSRETSIGIDEPPWRFVEECCPPMAPPPAMDEYSYGALADSTSTAIGFASQDEAHSRWEAEKDFWLAHLEKELGL